MPAQAAFVILDRMTAPVLVFDAKTLQVSHLNRAAANFALKAREDDLDLADLPTWLNLEADDAQVLFSKAAPLNSGVQKFDVSHLDSYFDVSVQRPPESGFDDQIVAIFNDVTGRQESERLKHEFVSTVSHELRSPLTAIKGAMGLVLAGTAGELPQRARDMIQISQRNADRLILIINDILDLDKIADGAMVFDNADVDLGEIVETAVESISDFRDRFDVRITTQIDIAGVTSFVDPNRMVQVLVNLMSNAIKFSPTGGEVTILVGVHGDFNRISITDRGEGISKAEQEFLFQRFVQIGSKNRAATGGTGLGLSIVQAILDKQDGQISFDSEVGRGTTFFVDLPKSMALSGQNQNKRVQNL